MTGCESLRRAQGFRLPPTFSLLWTLSPKISLECPFLFLLSFLSGHSEIPPATTVFFYKKSPNWGIFLYILNQYYFDSAGASAAASVAGSATTSVVSVTSSTTGALIMSTTVTLKTTSLPANSGT